jgi:hypothetical protein
MNVMCFFESVWMRNMFYIDWRSALNTIGKPSEQAYCTHIAHSAWPTEKTN